jgi:sodium transport system permease protein
MYTLMGEGMMKQLSTADDYVAKAYVVNMPEDVKMMVSGLRIEWEDWDGNPADKEKILKEIEEGEKDLLVYFPENFTADVEAYNMENKAPNIEMYFNSEKSNSETAYRMMQSFLTAYEETMVNKYDVNAGPGEGTYGKYDMASEAGILGKMLSGLLPMLIMTFIFSGCSGVAPESIAGEKERGTIATLLVTPVKRSALALGKIISLSVIALLAGVSSFLGTILSLPKMVGNEVDINVVSYSITDYLLLFVVIISTVLVMVSIISIVSASAKSVKEATTMMAPFMIGVMLISILPMLGADIGGKAAYAIPLFNSVKAMSAIFGFETDVVMSLVAVGVNLVATGVLVMVLTKMFDNENVMFGK